MAGYTVYAPCVLQVSKPLQFNRLAIFCRTISLCHFFKFLAQDLLSFAASCSYHSFVIGSYLPCGTDFLFHLGSLSILPQNWPLLIFSCGFVCLLLHLPVCSFVQFQSTSLWYILLLWIQVTILLKIQLFFCVPCLPSIEPSYFRDYCSNPGTKKCICFLQTDFIGCSPNLIWVGPAAASTQ